MTQTTDDPAIPQQGPVVAFLAHLGLTDVMTGEWAESGKQASEVYAWGERVDTAFDALESALRDAADYLECHDCSYGGDNTCADCGLQGRISAALALAEGVRG